MATKRATRKKDTFGGVVVLVVGGLFATWAALMTLWITYGAAGLIALVCVVGGVVLVVAGTWGVVVARRRAAEAEAEADYHAWLAEFPAPLQHAMRRLSTDYEAAKVWSAVGLGREPRQVGTGDNATFDPGAWPKLVPRPHPSSRPARARRWRRVRTPINHLIDRGAVTTRTGVRVRLRMLDGQEPGDFTPARCRALAAALNIPARPGREPAVRVEGGSGYIVLLDLICADPLDKPIMARQPEEPVNLYGVLLGVRADGRPWREALMERNWLVAGSMGAGKSGVMRSMVLATAPAARDGLVRNLGIDLKFGIEMKQLEGLIHEVATTASAAKEMLQYALTIVEERGRAMEAAGVDKHTPTPDAPLWIIIIDELAELLDDPGSRNEILSLMRHIMRPGRALGVSIAAFTQSPEKENIASVRNLFQIRIGLRLTEESMLPMLYGAEAKERGAANTLLPDQGTQGIAFVAAEGGRDIERVRSFWVPGDMLAMAAQVYPIYRNPKLERDTSLALEGGNVVDIDSHHLSIIDADIDDDVVICALPDCDNVVEWTGKGRPGKYCSPAHRNAAYRLRKSAEDGDADDTDAGEEKAV